LLGPSLQATSVLATFGGTISVQLSGTASRYDLLPRRLQSSLDICRSDGWFDLRAYEALFPLECGRLPAQSCQRSGLVYLHPRDGVLYCRSSSLLGFCPATLCSLSPQAPRSRSQCSVPRTSLLEQEHRHRYCPPRQAEPKELHVRLRGEDP